MKTVNDVTKKLTNEKRKAVNSLKDKSGRLITEEIQKRARWKELSQEVLNASDPEDPIRQSDVDKILENEVSETDYVYISTGEIGVAMDDMSSGNLAPGRDGLTVELLKVNNIATEWILQELFKVIWDTEEIPSGWAKGIIIKVPKKGDLTVYVN